MCGSQALGCAVSVVKGIVALATQVGGLYMDILIRSLKAGFLIGFESFLSTQGDELGMLEDLDCAALWLNSVTIRLVKLSASPFTYPPNIFDNIDKYTGMVFQGNIDVRSFCSHHHLAFIGHAHVAYIPCTITTCSILAPYRLWS